MRRNGRKNSFSSWFCLIEYRFMFFHLRWVVLVSISNISVIKFIHINWWSSLRMVQFHHRDKSFLTKILQLSFIINRCSNFRKFIWFLISLSTKSGISLMFQLSKIIFLCQKTSCSGYIICFLINRIFIYFNYYIVNIFFNYYLRV